VEYIHPAQGFSVAYLAQVHLGGLEILMPQQQLTLGFLILYPIYCRKWNPKIARNCPYFGHQENIYLPVGNGAMDVTIRCYILPELGSFCPNALISI
jgi:hypothetical protein